MKFQIVAEVFESLEKISGRLEITQTLAELFKKADPDEAAMIAYLSLGDVQPVYLSTQFNFAEKSMRNVVANLIDKTPETVKKHAHKYGDLGEVLAQNYEGGEFSRAQSLTQVHDWLIDFLKITGTGSQEKKEQELYDFFLKLDPLSCKYVARVILGKLRLGFSDMTLLDAFSWMEVGDKSLRKDLEDAYNISVDIGLIVKVLKEKDLMGIQKISITTGIPIRPAAAERAPDAQAIFRKLGNCVAQQKLDGFRVQVHVDKTKKNPEVHFYSRNLQDMSDMFPELRKAVLDLPVKTFVAEGEAIAYDIETHSFLPFQETVKRKRKHNIAEVAQDFPLKLYFFDLLYLDDKPFLDKTHEDRRKKLGKLLEDKKVIEHGTMYLVDEKEIHNSHDLEEYFMQSIEVGLEGLVVKRADAIYQPGKRNFNWIKLKRQESGSLDDTIDCVILGYYFGHGKRAKFGIGALLVGVYNKDKDCFQTVAKIGTGLTDEQWKQQKKMCDEIQIDHQPKNVECVKELYPDVWVMPKIVCMIRADEITSSPAHTAGKEKDRPGLALRFPRIMGYRDDKSPSETTSEKELERLFNMQFKKRWKDESKKKDDKDKQKTIF